MPLRFWSVLDAALKTLKENGEKTYSAPFAVQLYMKETVLDSKGVERREYPRLKFGGRHINYPQREQATDIRWQATRGIGAGVICGVAIILLVTSFLSFYYRENLFSVLWTIAKGPRSSSVAKSV